MIIKQQFDRGNEIKNGEEFFAALPDCAVLQESVEAVLDVIANCVTYKEFFILEIDTDACSAEVVDVV